MRITVNLVPNLNFILFTMDATHEPERQANATGASIMRLVLKVSELSTEGAFSTVQARKEPEYEDGANSATII